MFAACCRADYLRRGISLTAPSRGHGYCYWATPSAATSTAAAVAAATATTRAAWHGRITYLTSNGRVTIPQSSGRAVRRSSAAYRLPRLAFPTTRPAGSPLAALTARRWRPPSVTAAIGPSTPLATAIPAARPSNLQHAAAATRAGVACQRVPRLSPRRRRWRRLTPFTAHLAPNDRIEPNASRRRCHP